MKHWRKLSFCTFVLALIIMGNTAYAAGLGTNIAVRLVGTGDLFIGDELFDEFDLTPVGALCYEIPLVDIKTGNVIGSAADCLSDINPDGDGVALTGTPFYMVPLISLIPLVQFHNQGRTAWFMAMVNFRMQVAL